MGEPEVLKSLLQLAIESVRADPVHDLALGMRRKIWLSLGREQGLGPGDARRVALAHATARHVIPLWESKYSQGAAAGFSTVQVLFTCIDDETLPLTEYAENLRDNQIDAEDMDASMFAATAFAGGPSWMKGGISSQARTGHAT